MSDHLQTLDPAARRRALLELLREAKARGLFATEGRADDQRVTCND